MGCPVGAEASSGGMGQAYDSQALRVFVGLACSGALADIDATLAYKGASIQLAAREIGGVFADANDCARLEFLDDGGVEMPAVFTQVLEVGALFQGGGGLGRQKD